MLVGDHIGPKKVGGSSRQWTDGKIVSLNLWLLAYLRKTPIFVFR